MTKKDNLSPHFLWGAEFFYVYDGDGNIVRSIDLTSKKKYDYEYEEGRIVRATEADIELSGEIVTSKVIVNTVKYIITIPKVRWPRRWSLPPADLPRPSKPNF